MQISYLSTLTKIQKLQNLKIIKKKNFYIARYAWYRSLLLKIGRYGWYMTGTWPVRSVFKLVRNVDVSIPVYIPIQYISTSTAGTGMVLTTLPYTSYIVNCSSFMAREHLYFRHEAPQ